MAYQNFSESEQMYLVRLAQLAAKAPGQPVPLSTLAQRLGVQPVSANQMVRKLAQNGYVHYEPYQGVTLSPQGTEQANQVLRARRLWAVFLNEHLDYPAKEADALACALEHDTPPELATRLSAYLGNPDRDPLGHPISQGNETTPKRGLLPLTTLKVGIPFKVAVLPEEPSSAAFLKSHGLSPGSVVQILALHDGGDVLLQTPQGNLMLSSALAAQTLCEFLENL